MYVRKTYVAEDGKEFKYESECRAYEAMLFDQLYSATITPFVATFGNGGILIPFARINEIRFVYVKKSPDFEDEEFMDIWERIIPGQLTEIISDCGDGWYFRDDYNNWYSWTQKEKMHEQMKKAFDKMYEQINK